VASSLLGSTDPTRGLWDSDLWAWQHLMAGIDYRRQSGLQASRSIGLGSNSLEGAQWT